MTRQPILQVDAASVIDGPPGVPFWPAKVAQFTLQFGVAISFGLTPRQRVRNNFVEAFHWRCPVHSVSIGGGSSRNTRRALLLQVIGEFVGQLFVEQRGFSVYGPIGLC